MLVDPPECGSLLEASNMACGLLLVYVPVVVDIVSVVVPQERIAAFNEILQIIEEVRHRLQEQISRLSERVASVLYWTSALLVHTQGDGYNTDAEVDAWLRGPAVAAPTLIGRPSGVEVTQETQDDRSGISPRKTGRITGAAGGPSSELPSMAAVLTRLAEQCGAAAEVHSNLSLNLERAQTKCDQQALTIGSQEYEIASLRDTLMQVRQQLMEESSNHATQVSQLTSAVRQLQDTTSAQSTRIKTLERQIKRYEQMSAVIRSMTNEVSGPNEEGS
jgi:hypothetical protein